MRTADVVIIGGGVAGLMLFKKLSRLGASTLLVEKMPQVAGGPSTRNEGWLHRGTYHSVSIRNRNQALEVAKRCIYGYDQIRAYAPECVEDASKPSIALLRDITRLDEVLSRWNDAGVRHRRLSSGEAITLAPNVAFGDAVAFLVTDTGINTRVLYARLLADAIRAGGQFIPNATLEFDASGSEARIVTVDRTIAIDAQCFVYTCGYAIREVFALCHSMAVPSRFWKSHLLVTPRLSEYSIFCLDPGEAAMMNHDEYSIVGLNEDAVLCEQPNFEVLPRREHELRQAVGRLFPNQPNTLMRPIACIKTDFLNPRDPSRSLNIGIVEPKAGHICAIPGKMTEAPALTDELTRRIYCRLGNSPVALRPVDHFSRQDFASAN